MSWQANTVREDSEALIKTQLDLNSQTAHHTTGHTILADAQHMAKPVSYVKKNHFAGSPTCQGGNTIRALEANDTPTTYSYDNQPVSNLEVGEIGQISTTNPENKITLHINNKEIQLYVDSGCKKTIIPQTQYTKSLGLIKPSKTRFRPYGTQEHLTTLGEQPAYNPVMEQSILPPFMLCRDTRLNHC